MNSIKNNKWIEQISSIFQSADDRYIAHKLVQPILIEMAKDKSFMYEVIRKNLSDTKYLQKKRHYSTMAMEILQTENFHFVLNIFPSLPDKRTDISFQNIHHHGNLLLSTIAAFGQGYSSFIFDKEFSIDELTREAKLKIKRYYKNTIGNIEFIDARVPHVVFYPEKISATYALWSNAKKNSYDNLKQIGVIKKIKKPLLKLIGLLKIKKKLGVNDQENYDFYTDNKKLYSLKDRIKYPIGSNENFIQNILSFIQQTGFNDVDFMKNILVRDNLTPEAKKWINKFIEKESISEKFESIHLNVEKINLTKSDIEEAAGYIS